MISILWDMKDELPPSYKYGLTVLRFPLLLLLDRLCELYSVSLYSIQELIFVTLELQFCFYFLCFPRVCLRSFTLCSILHKVGSLLLCFFSKCDRLPSWEVDARKM